MSTVVECSYEEYLIVYLITFPVYDMRWTSDDSCILT